MQRSAARRPPGPSAHPPGSERTTRDHHLSLLPSATGAHCCPRLRNVPPPPLLAAPSCVVVVAVVAVVIAVGSLVRSFDRPGPGHQRRRRVRLLVDVDDSAWGPAIILSSAARCCAVLLALGASATSTVLGLATTRHCDPRPRQQAASRTHFIYLPS